MKKLILVLFCTFVGLSTSVSAMQIEKVEEYIEPKIVGQTFKQLFKSRKLKFTFKEEDENVYVSINNCDSSHKFNIYNYRIKSPNWAVYVNTIDDINRIYSSFESIVLESFDYTYDIPFEEDHCKLIKIVGVEIHLSSVIYSKTDVYYLNKFLHKLFFVDKKGATIDGYINTVYSEHSRYDKKETMANIDRIIITIVPTSINGIDVKELVDDR